MSAGLPAYEPFRLSGGELRQAVSRYAVNPLYLDGEHWTNDDNPYRRQMRPQDLDRLDFDRVLPTSEILGNTSLAAQRLLTTIYEHDLMFLPEAGFEGKRADFDAFYSASNRTLGEIIRPALERNAFGFLDEEVKVTGEWTRESFRAYLEAFNERGVDAVSPAIKAAEDSTDPKRATRMYLLQFAADFLSEASPMVRQVLGHYGQPQSEWFKIIIDEYGYGVYEAKHSRLWEKTLESVGLRSDVHHYWQFYMGSSLLLNNYFHLLGKNHEYFFRHLGGLYYTETALIESCRQQAALLSNVFGDSADIKYFTEHVHIDTHHSRMAIDKLIWPIIDKCGEAVIPHVVRGFEEMQAMNEIADRDLADQIAWMDSGASYKALHEPVWAAIQSGKVTAPVQRLVEPRGKLTTTYVHDEDVLCHVVSGTLKICSGIDAYETLESGQGMVIPRERLHGAVVESEECVYEIHSVGDYRACLS
ncbi:iron-containing redox enzyme family protein [Kitasatospora kifunensis]|uniref:Cupin n=1 Tax=Kitasatospora kifunensis TaxID=58351 RepID=A0A7W7VVA2_KITKI|nr:iron-containing redox enzyme family protein [Kitasatospora kifunensis]MBB4923474.1 hypothetical protein [Kitasatospora kifunensis]